MIYCSLIEMVFDDGFMQSRLSSLELSPRINVSLVDAVKERKECVKEGKERKECVKERKKVLKGEELDV